MLCMIERDTPGRRKSLRLNNILYFARDYGFVRRGVASMTPHTLLEVRHVLRASVHVPLIYSRDGCIVYRNCVLHSNDWAAE